MRLTCTACGATGSIEQFTADTDARRFIDLLLQLPQPVAKVALQYASLFRPHKRGLTWDRACSVIGELLAMVTAGQVEHYGKPYPASASLFAAGVQQMLDGRERLTLPLKSHGYLVAIIVAASPKDAAATEQQAELQKQHDSQNRHRELESQEQRMRRIRIEAEQAEARRVVDRLKS